MLSRVAERAYWLARYLERAENTARFVNVYSALLLDLPRSAGLGWDLALEINGSAEAFAATGQPATALNMLQYLLHDQSNPSSLLGSLTMARENTRTTRDIVPTEIWRAVNELCLYARQNLPAAAEERQRAEVMAHIVASVQGITGMLAGTMSQGQPYQFIRMGRNLERADMTTRMIDVAAAVLMTGRPELERYNNTLWMAVLRCLSGYQMYRQYVRRRVHGPDVIAFLLQDREFPRALTHCANEVMDALATLPRSEKAVTRTQSMCSLLAKLEPATLDNRGVHQLVDELQLKIAAINDAIAATWFYLENS